MKYYSYLFILLLFAGCTKSNLPSGVFISPATYDFGTVTDQDWVTGEFTIFNNTSVAVQIVNTEVSCGCTTLDLSAKTILPQESITLKMTADIKGRHGKQVFQAIIVTDNSIARAVRAELVGTVIATKLSGVLPFDLGPFPPSTEIDETISVSKNDSSAARIEDIEIIEGEFATVTNDQSNDDQRFYRLKVQGRSPQQVGLFHTRARITTDNPNLKQLEILLSGQVKSRWIYPSEIFLGFLKPGEMKKREIQCKDAFANTSQGSPISKVSVDCDCAAISATARIVSSDVIIDLIAQPQSEAKTIDCSVKVVVTTADLRNQLFVIPVHGRVLTAD